MTTCPRWRIHLEFLEAGLTGFGRKALTDKWNLIIAAIALPHTHPAACQSD